MNPSIKKTKAKPSGFTLMETILVIGFFALISTVLMSSLLSVYQFRDMIQAKKNLNAEASILLNNTLPALIRPGVGIHYDNSKLTQVFEKNEGYQQKVDQISIFTDRQEKEYFTIYRQSNSEGKDVKPLHLEFSNGEVVPLHSSRVVVEEFQVHVPTDPRSGGDRTLQPYARLYLRLRANSTKKNEEKPIITSYTTTLTLRNTSPASYKTPLKSI